MFQIQLKLHPQNLFPLSPQEPPSCPFLSLLPLSLSFSFPFSPQETIVLKLIYNITVSVFMLFPVCV